MNWRAIEREIIDVLYRRGFRFDQHSHSGDIIVVTAPRRLNITTLAQELSERVEVKGGNG